jgi:hypothetical protein
MVRSGLESRDEAGRSTHREPAKAAGEWQTFMTRVKKNFYKVQGQSITWVGECPWTNTLCFGSEDGKLHFTQDSPEIGEAIIATDAINAVAFADNLFAVSSRHEVRIGRRPAQNGGGLDVFSHGFRGGAHGVVASQTGAFLAPIGDQGLLLLKLDHCGVGVQTASHWDLPFNFYKLIRLGTAPQGEEVFASAGRGDGLLAFPFSKEAVSVSGTHHSFEAHDIVDVCPLNDPHYPLAVACLSRSRAVFLIRDVIEDQTPFALNYGGIQGTPYSLLSAQGHLFLLTDRELIILPNVASRFLRGESLVGPLEIACVPVNVSEAFLRRDQAILLIEEDSSVAQLEIEDLIEAKASAHRQAGLEWNGSPHQESSIGTTDEVPPVDNVALEVKTVDFGPIGTGWHRNDPFNLVLIPAA